MHFKSIKNSSISSIMFLIVNELNVANEAPHSHAHAARAQANLGQFLKLYHYCHNFSPC